MLPFSKAGPLDRTERKALIVAAVSSCLFIVIVSFALPHERRTKGPSVTVNIPAPVVPHKLPEPELSVMDSIERFRVKPAHFEQIDFENYSYGPYSSPDAGKIDLTLKQGELELPDNSSWFTLKDVYYTDMTGDGKAEAIVWIFHVSCGVSCDGGTNMFYIYTERNGKLKPIWQYETGSYADGCGLESFTAGGTQLVMELFGRCPKPGMQDPGSSKYMAKDLTFVVYKFNGQRYVKKSIEFFDSAETDVRNYEPGIRIY